MYIFSVDLLLYLFFSCKQKGGKKTKECRPYRGMWNIEECRMYSPYSIASNKSQHCLSQKCEAFLEKVINESPPKLALTVLVFVFNYSFSIFPFRNP